MAPNVAPTVNLTPVQQQGPPNGELMGPPGYQGGRGGMQQSCVAISKQLLSPSLHHVLCLHLQGRKLTQLTVLGSTVAFCCAP